MRMGGGFVCPSWNNDSQLLLASSSHTPSSSFLPSFYVLLLWFPEEATALIGAHSIGMTRHTFGSILAGPVSS